MTSDASPLPERRYPVLPRLSARTAGGARVGERRGELRSVPVAHTARQRHATVRPLPPRTASPPSRLPTTWTASPTGRKDRQDRQDRQDATATSGPAHPLPGSTAEAVETTHAARTHTRASKRRPQPTAPAASTRYR
ncbi:hypothetical protein [Streptomyces mobaraensis]|uniref:Uncharacterized protein n=1 Tax=Streptomyces mobaraensis TaxID=35621 RepID=A0A5N5WFA5_STRMB|nr:hypothetical protein [Streptomyces mobaraensis]KAB7852677.1 hypothetical protein FRZ00_00215 [Streptomyces mobaraensis]